MSSCRIKKLSCISKRSPFSSSWWNWNPLPLLILVSASMALEFRAPLSRETFKAEASTSSLPSPRQSPTLSSSTSLQGTNRSATSHGSAPPAVQLGTSLPSSLSTSVPPKLLPSQPFNNDQRSSFVLQPSNGGHIRANNLFGNDIRRQQQNFFRQTPPGRFFGPQEIQPMVSNGFQRQFGASGQVDGLNQGFLRSRPLPVANRRTGGSYGSNTQGHSNARISLAQQQTPPTRFSFTPNVPNFASTISASFGATNKLVPSVFGPSFQTTPPPATVQQFFTGTTSTSYSVPTSTKTFSRKTTSYYSPPPTTTTTTTTTTTPRPTTTRRTTTTTTTTTPRPTTTTRRTTTTTTTTPRPTTTTTTTTTTPRPTTTTTRISFAPPLEDLGFFIPGGLRNVRPTGIQDDDDRISRSFQLPRAQLLQAQPAATTPSTTLIPIYATLDPSVNIKLDDLSVGNSARFPGGSSKSPVGNSESAVSQQRTLLDKMKTAIKGIISSMDSVDNAKDVSKRKALLEIMRSKPKFLQESDFSRKERDIIFSQSGLRQDLANPDSFRISNAEFFRTRSHGDILVLRYVAPQDGGRSGVAALETLVLDLPEKLRPVLRAKKQKDDERDAVDDDEQDDSRQSEPAEKIMFDNLLSRRKTEPLATIPPFSEKTFKEQVEDFIDRIVTGQGTRLTDLVKSGKFTKPMEDEKKSENLRSPPLIQTIRNNKNRGLRSSDGVRSIGRKNNGDTGKKERKVDLDKLIALISEARSASSSTDTDDGENNQVRRFGRESSSSGENEERVQFLNPAWRN